ncbi:FIG00470045: hypothetical protein [hydrothermal vent metagenome]|uniref:Uncharacterized protein n=1 Tax=hydrothermal vent metagenome TaxID=652676 RepID=A0A1W1B956_9ZZZZ
MKKSIIILIFLTSTLFGDVKERMFNLYENERYEDVCNIGFKNFTRYAKDEDFISLYAFGCLKSDFIDRLSIPISILKYTKEARANAAYLSVILMQKKLLYHALVDGYELDKYKFPTTDYILSKIFDYYVALGKHESRNFYLFTDKTNNKLSYKLYLVKEKVPYKMVIEEYYDNSLVKKHIYW